MKVLKYSTNPKTWKIQIACAWCDSQLEVKADDISHQGEPGDMKDEGWDRYTCKCGACGETIEIDEKKLPNIIQSYVEKE